MNNKENELLWKLREYKDLISALEIVKRILCELNENTYYKPYELIEKDLDILQFKIYKKYEKIYEKVEKIKNKLTIDDILSFEYE